MSDEPAEKKLRLGVSSCLLGQEVRFDGGHKRDSFLNNELAPWTDWVPVCPEVEAGLTTPRPAMRLVRDQGSIRVRERKTREDHTERMREFSERRAAELSGLALDGYIFKKDSPSCGVYRVSIYNESGMPDKNGRGVFADALVRAFPNLPVEEEGRLKDPRLRENFIERIYAFQRLRARFQSAWKPRDLIEFHSRQKLQLLAHSPEAYRSLGRMVAEAHRADADAFRDEYIDAYMGALSVLASRGRNANVLQHFAGHFKQQLESAVRQELAKLIDEYRRGLVPLVVPITLVNHHIHRLDNQYLAAQTFLEPYPRELMLRNSV